MPDFWKTGFPIGIVTAIAAPASIKVDFEGNGGHAGAVLMPSRSIMPYACKFVSVDTTC